VADACIFLEELLSLPKGRMRSYDLIGSRDGLACVDARLRMGQDWYFARKWVTYRGSARPLYRLIDQVEAAGFHFRVESYTRRPESRTNPDESLELRASVLRAGLAEEERRIHAELFPDEARLLDAGYDWDGRFVYKGGAILAPDPFGRILDRDLGVLYEWVPIPDEGTWRRFPLERIREAITVRGT
jgi:hypothetical protein